MFAPLEQMQAVPIPTHCPWTPARPSPLSPRRQSSAATTTTTTTTTWTTPMNQPQFQSPTSTSIFTFTPSPSPLNNKTTSHTSTSPSLPHANNNATSPTPYSQKSTYATRYTTQISNPLNASTKNPFASSSASPGARSVRRNAFLNRVRADRDTGRFEARSEHLAYVEGVAEKKAFLEGLRRGAEEVTNGFGVGIEEGEDIGFEDGGAEEEDILALDEYIAQERAAEMELVAQIEGANANSGHPSSGHDAPAASFSDDEYDDIFVDLADHSQGQGHGQSDMDMDMSG
ncbi:hypothetical protein BDV06DRAFT_218687 [Aspergillus oleicola]